MDLFERFGFSQDAEKQALQDTVLDKQEFKLPDELNLFSYNYKVGEYDFKSELAQPDWIDPEIWKTINK